MIDIQIHTEREMAPIYEMGRTNLLAFNAQANEEPPRQDTENYYEHTRLRRPNDYRDLRTYTGYVPGTYTNIAMQPPREIRIDCEISIADDPADQESILEFMEK